MTVRASFRASAVVPPRRLSMARASVRTVIMFRTSLHVYLGLRRPYTFAGLSPHSPEPDSGRNGRAGRSATLFLSRVNMEEHLLRGPRDVGETEIPMKRKSGKSVVDLGKEPAVVHFNVGSGYVSYLASDTAGQTPRVKSVVISREPT